MANDRLRNGYVRGEALSSRRQPGLWPYKERSGGTLLGGEDFTAKLMNDMPEELLNFIQTRINSFIKWDIIRFLYENPYTTDTAAGIARYIGRTEASITPELDELVASGVMETQQVGGKTVYALSQDPEIRRLVETFIRACEDRHFRVKAVYHIIRNMR